MIRGTVTALCKEKVFISNGESSDELEPGVGLAGVHETFIALVTESATTEVVDIVASGAVLFDCVVVAVF